MNDKESVKELSMGNDKFEVYYSSNSVSKEQEEEDAEEEEEEEEGDEESDDETCKIHTLDDFFKIADDKEKQNQQLLGKKTNRCLNNQSNDDDDNNRNDNGYKREFNPNLQELLDLFKETKYPIVYKTINNERDIDKNEKKINLKNIITSLNINKSSISLEELTSPHDQIKLSNNTSSSIQSPTLSKPKAKSQHYNRQQQQQHQQQAFNIKDEFESLLQSLKWSLDLIPTAKKILDHINAITIPPQPKYKLNIVFDLDNTLIFSALTSTVKFKNGLINIQCQTEKGSFYSTFIFRKGIDHFIQATRSFCNYYVYSLGMVSYVDEIIKEIEKNYSIRIVNHIGRKGNENQKDLSLLFPNKKDRDMTVIIDDLNRPWGSYYIYIINSMKFIDSFFINENNRQFHPNDFSPLHYNCNVSDDDWSVTQTNPHQSYFGENSDEHHIPLHSEYNQSMKNQLDYLGEVMRKVYLISVYAQVPTDKAIAFIRKTTLMGCVFSLDYCCINHDVKQMIITLGGELYQDKNNQSGLSEYKITHMIISNNMKQKYMEDKKNIMPKGVFVVNNKYIFHSYYFMQKMNEVDIEYQP